MVVERPYKVPIPDWGAFLLVLPPTLLTVIVLFLSSWLTLLYTLVVIIIGLILHRLKSIARERRWCEFCEEGQSPLKHDYNPF